MQTAYQLVWMSAEHSPDHTAVVDDSTDRRLSYRELVGEIDATAAGLRRQGIARGDIVATVTPNRLDFVVAMLALARLGAVPALISPRLKATEIAQLVTEAKADASIAPADAGLVGALAEATGRTVLTVGGALEGTVDLADCRADPGELGPYHPPRPEDPAFIFYTSGTTGLPKGVVTPERATEPRVLFMCTQGGLVHGAHNRLIGLMPLSHNVGFYAVMLAALALGGTYYVVPAFDPPAAVDLIDREGITCVFASPTHFHGLLGAPNCTPERLRSVELALYAGAPMGEELQRRVAGTLTGRFVQIYGTTETMNSLYHPDPVGRPHTLRPGYYSRVRVVRIGGGVDDVAAVGERGELLVDAGADATFTGYLNRPEATAQRLDGGWYRTGDIAYVDDAGDVVLVGRADNMIISGAENIYPEEVERVLGAQKGVYDVAVVGVPDDRWGELVVACVVAEPTVTAEALDIACRSSALADFKRPRRFAFLERLPRNPSGKVLRGELRDLFV